MELFAKLHRRNMLWKLAGWICLIGTIIWGGQSFFEQSPTRYYWSDDGYAVRYEKMLPLARELG